jgi:hypothetical protein
LAAAIGLLESNLTRADVRAETSANAEKAASPQDLSAGNYKIYEWCWHCNSFERGTPDGLNMTLKIERYSDERSTTIRLIGRIRAEHLEELKAQIGESGSKIALDMEEVNLVDVDVIRFLGNCQRQGVCLVHCPRYMSDWIAKERDFKE